MAGESNKLKESPPEEAKAETPVKDEPDVAAEAGAPLRFPWRPAEPALGGVKPLEPLEPLTDSDYADRISEALEPSKIMAPLMPVGDSVASEPRMRGFTAVRQPLQFACPYGFEGRCCGCRYMPCNELTLAVLGHVSRDYGPGGRCSAD